MKAEEQVAGAVSLPLDLDAVARDQLPRVERLLLRILGPRKDMEDLVQTVFLELCRALPRRRGEAALSTFVGGITVNVARRAMRPTAFLRRRAALSEDTDSGVASPERHATAREQLRCVRQALDRLSPKKRVAFCLWAFEGMSLQEIAEITSASESTTRSRIWYAQRALRASAAKNPALREALVGT